MSDMRVRFKCVTTVRLCAARAVHTRHPFPVSAHLRGWFLRGWLEKLRHVASVRLTCMQRSAFLPPPGCVSMSVNERRRVLKKTATSHMTGDIKRPDMTETDIDSPVSRRGRLIEHLIRLAFRCAAT